MAKFFINRPIVAMVISIVMTIVGLIAMVQLPISEFPDIAPPEIQLQATYVGADAVTLEKSVATPIEQMMSGVDNMIYMSSVNASNGQMTLRVDFDINTRPNDDQILAQMRYTQAESQLPQDVRNFGVTIKKSTTSPLALFSLYSPNGTYDATFLANYAYVNINDPMTRVRGIGQVTIFGAGQYAMRFWVRPDQLAKLGITVTEIVNAVKAQNTVNPAGQVGMEPVPPGQEFTYTVRAQGRLETIEEFENIVIRANPDGSIVRLKDVARAELGAQMYNVIGRMNGTPSAIIAIYQLPGSNAIQTMDAAIVLGQLGFLLRELLRRGPAVEDVTDRRFQTLGDRRQERRFPEPQRGLVDPADFVFRSGHGSSVSRRAMRRSSLSWAENRSGDANFRDARRGSRRRSQRERQPPGAEEERERRQRQPPRT